MTVGICLTIGREERRGAIKLFCASFLHIPTHSALFHFQQGVWMGAPLLFDTSWFPKKTVLGLAVLLVLPTPASAFSLGNIQVRTQFGEPFQADIPLLLYPDEQAKGAEASVADAEAYQRLKLPRDLAVTQLTVQMQGKGANRQIVLQSDTPLRIPFFNLLMKTSVGVGSHYRNYPVFLKMPQADHEAVPTNRHRSLPSFKMSQADHRALPSEETPPHLSKTTQPNGASGQQSYGPVRRGESLYSIARKMQPPGASISQTMVALWSLNKDKPGFDNINTLPVGTLLDRPTQEAITRLSASEVAQVLESQRQTKQNKTAVTVTVQSKPSAPVHANQSNTQSGPLTEAAEKPAAPLPATEAAEKPASPAPTTEAQVTKTVPSSVPPPSIEPTSATPPLSIAEEQATQPAPPSVASDRVEENQPWIARLNKAEAQIELLSSQLMELATHSRQVETELATVQAALATIPARLQRLEHLSQKSMEPATVTPTPPLSPSSAPQGEPSQPKTAEKEVPLDESWLLYGGSALAGFLAILLAWLKRKKTEPLDTPVMTVAQPVESRPLDEMPPQEEEKASPFYRKPALPTAPPAISVATVVSPTSAPSEPLFLEKPAIRSDRSEGAELPSSLSPFQKAEEESGLFVSSVEQTETLSDNSEHLDTLSSSSPFQEEEGESGLVVPVVPLESREVASITNPVKRTSTVVALANEAVDEIEVDDDEESIFKELLESEPKTEHPVHQPAIRAGLVLDVVGQGEEEPLEMFEFKPISIEPVVQKKSDKPAQSPTKPATDIGEDIVLEWVVDEK